MQLIVKPEKQSGPYRLETEGATTTWTVGGNVLITGSQWGALYGNDISTGKLLWMNSQTGLSDRGASAAIHDGLLFIISRNSFFIIDARC